MSALPTLATDRPWTEGEVRRMASRWNAAMREWGRRHGIATEGRWTIERSARQLVHLHGLLRVPRPLARECRAHSRSVLAKLLGVAEKDLHPRAIRHHGRWGGVAAPAAVRWWSYCMKGIEEGDRHAVKAGKLLPVAGRRFGQPQRRGGTDG